MSGSRPLYPTAAEYKTHSCARNVACFQLINHLFLCVVNLIFPLSEKPRELGHQPPHCPRDDQTAHSAQPDTAHYGVYVVTLILIGVFVPIEISITLNPAAWRMSTQLRAVR